jgi:hypothetical protein
VGVCWSEEICRGGLILLAAKCEVPAMVIQAYGFSREAILGIIAHKLYESRGVHGSQESDWLRAEQIYEAKKTTPEGERICRFFAYGKSKIEVRFGPDCPS